MNKPVGGRGKRAPYNTVIVRVPEDLVSRLEIIIDAYRETKISSDTTLDKLNILDSFNGKSNLLEKDEIITKAKSILRDKKSAKVSLTKLLTFLYQEEINL